MTDEHSLTGESKSKALKGRAAWQLRLLPLMIRMLVGLTAFFFLVTLGQLFYLNASINSSPSLAPSDLMADARAESSAARDPAAESDHVQLLARLEANVVARRYHQANVALMAAIWSKYLGFMTGMTLAMVGAAFVLGQLQSTRTDLTGKAAGAEFILRSASPGLALVVLGVVLMIATIVTQSQVNATDVPVYVGRDKPDSTDLDRLLNGGNTE